MICEQSCVRKRKGTTEGRGQDRIYRKSIVAGVWRQKAVTREKKGGVTRAEEEDEEEGSKKGDRLAAFSPLEGKRQESGPTTMWVGQAGSRGTTAAEELRERSQEEKANGRAEGSGVESRRGEQER